MRLISAQKVINSETFTPELQVVLTIPFERAKPGVIVDYEDIGKRFMKMFEND